TPDKEIGIGGSDPGSGVDTTYYRINGGEWQEISGGGEKSFALSDHGVGDDQEVKVDYYSVDIAGNREATKSLSLKTDKDKEYFAIVLNKISPNPSGGNKGSSDLPLDGEWVEVWNNSESDLDISGWYLKDYNGDVLPVVNHADNDDDLTTVETVVPAGGWLRIYRNGSSLFNLPEEGGEVLLFDDSDSLIDSFSYGEVDQTDKVWQRIPEGTGIWTDPEDTEFSLSLDYKEGKVNLVITGLKETTKGEYELLYKSKGIEKGVLGEVTGKEIKEGTYKEEVLLGSCSGKVCVFDKVDENKITLHLTLINPQVEMTKEFSW
ncbi:lamin tail domain-containing protein, partial [bacterium]|nr:lamin tail domain-containing protein [bacterium]